MSKLDEKLEELEDNLQVREQEKADEDEIIQELKVTVTVRTILTVIQRSLSSVIDRFNNSLDKQLENHRKSLMEDREGFLEASKSIAENSKVDWSGMPKEMQIANLKDLKIPVPILKSPEIKFPKEMQVKVLDTPPIPEPNSTVFNRNNFGLVTSIYCYYDAYTAIYELKRDTKGKIQSIVRSLADS